jgi:hypothetical protein
VYLKGTESEDVVRIRLVQDKVEVAATSEHGNGPSGLAKGGGIS